jgi:hypothetical protein
MRKALLVLVLSGVGWSQRSSPPTSGYGTLNTFLSSLTTVTTPGKTDIGTLSTTPTFTVLANSNPMVWTGTLPASNVTSSTLVTTAATIGQILQMDITQYSGGGVTFAFPANWLNPCTVSPTASIVTHAFAWWNGTNAIGYLCTSGDSPITGIPYLNAGTLPTVATSGQMLSTISMVPVANGGTNASTTSQNYIFVGPTSGSGAPGFRAAVAGDIPTNLRVRSFGGTFDGAGVALTAGKTVYTTVPYACTIAGWNIIADTGTATVDIWQLGTGTAIPTVTNTITASAIPALASGTVLHSTTMTSWATTHGGLVVAANDIFAFNLKVVASATYVNLVVECDQ